MMAREAVKALKAERKDLVRALRTVDSVLAKLGATVKRQRKTAKRKKKPGPKKEKGEKGASKPKASKPKALKPKSAPSAGSVDLELKREAARAARKEAL
jgi:hypothetical protein